MDKRPRIRRGKDVTQAVAFFFLKRNFVHYACKDFLFGNGLYCPEGVYDRTIAFWLFTIPTVVVEHRTGLIVGIGNKGADKRTTTVFTVADLVPVGVIFIHSFSPFLRKFVLLIRDSF